MSFAANLPLNDNSGFWQRAIILVDMNSFFASIEQREVPELRGKPIAITNGAIGTCLITASYEARAYGIKTGMRLPEAKLLCPSLIQVASRPRLYAQVSQQIMQALATVTPDIEEYSVDEAFLDVSHCQHLWGTPEVIGKLAQQKVWEAAGLPCSVGVSGDKTTAKYAADLHKPNGFTVIPPWEAKQCLQDVLVTELWGIGKGIAAFLARYGAYTCGDVAKLPISILAQRFGNLGRRMWYQCQGADPEPVHTQTKAPKSMGHGKVMPPRTKDKATILIYLQHMCEKLAARLRRHDMKAQHFFIGWRHDYLGWIGAKNKLAYPTQDGKIIYALGLSVLQKVWDGGPVHQVQVTALDPHATTAQSDFFETENLKRAHLNAMVDQINQRYGEFTVAPAPLLNRSGTHNVIAPSWKSSGHRQTL